MYRDWPWYFKQDLATLGLGQIWNMKEMVVKDNGRILRCYNHAWWKLLHLTDTQVGQVECAEMQHYAHHAECPHTCPTPTANK